MAPRWASVGLRGDRLCVGEAGPLSPDDSERLRDDRLRLVCSSDACLVILRNRDVLFLLQTQGTASKALSCVSMQR